MSKGKIGMAQLSQKVLDLIALGGNGNNTGVEFKKNSVTITTPSNRIAIGIIGYDKTKDLLMVYKNTIYLEETSMYRISADNRYIESVNGNWGDNNVPTLFNFVVIKASSNANPGGPNTALDEFKETTSINFERVNTEMSDKVDKTDILNSLTTGGLEKVVSAEQSKLMNNKIVELGLLTDKKAIYYNNISDMRKDTSLKNGQKVITAGYYKINDGGGACYSIDSSNEIENFGSIIILENGLRAKLIFDNRTFKLKQFGIRGDGVFRSISSVYPTLTIDDIKKYGNFTLSNSADSFMIRKLLKDIPNTSEIVLDGKVYLMDVTVELECLKTIRGVCSPNDYAFRATISGGDSAEYYASSILLAYVDGIDMFKTPTNFFYGNLKQFAAVGVYGKKEFPSKYSGNFISFTGVTSNFLAESLHIYGFKNGFKNYDEFIWSNFRNVVVDTTYENCIDITPCIPQYGYSGQVNEVAIENCRVFNSGVSYSGIRTTVYNREFGNGICVGGSGVKVDHVDVSFNTVGIAYDGYFSGNILQSTYSEGNIYADVFINRFHYEKDLTIINGYMQQNTNIKTKAELNGIIRSGYYRGNGVKYIHSNGKLRSNEAVSNNEHFIVSEFKKQIMIEFSILKSEFNSITSYLSIFPHIGFAKRDILNNLKAIDDIIYPLSYYIGTNCPYSVEHLELNKKDIVEINGAYFIIKSNNPTDNARLINIQKKFNDREFAKSRLSSANTAASNDIVSMETVSNGIKVTLSKNIVSGDLYSEEVSPYNYNSLIFSKWDYYNASSMHMINLQNSKYEVIDDYYVFREIISLSQCDIVDFGRLKKRFPDREPFWRISFNIKPLNIFNVSVCDATDEYRDVQKIFESISYIDTVYATNPNNKYGLWTVPVAGQTDGCKIIYNNIKFIGLNGKYYTELERAEFVNILPTAASMIGKCVYYDTNSKILIAKSDGWYTLDNIKI